MLFVQTHFSLCFIQKTRNKKQSEKKKREKKLFEKVKKTIRNN